MNSALPSCQSARSRLLDRLVRILSCPDCHTPFPADEWPFEERRVLSCSQCGRKLHYRGGQFSTGKGFTTEEVSRDWLNRLKESAKRRLGRLYPAMIRLLSPVHSPDLITPFLRQFDCDRQLVADLGAGTTQYRDRVVCVDGADYANVHLVTDLQKLPFQSDSLDGLLSVAVLEHVPDPAAHVREMWRVLRRGGRLLCFIPFIQGFHASPHDYQRYTIPGLRHLFSEFDVQETRIGAGPTSGFVWILQEWLALMFSFGSQRLYRLLVPCMWCLSPLKYLDILLARHPNAAVIASGFVIEARKPLLMANPEIVSLGAEPTDAHPKT